MKKNQSIQLSYAMALCIIAIISYCVSPVYADSSTITVCSQNCDFATIQAAIETADPTSVTTIVLLDPIHTEAGIVVDKNITLQGQEGGERPIIQGHTDTEQARNRIFLVQKDAHVHFKGLILQHGRATFRLHLPSGGAIYNYGTLLLEECLIRQNRATDGGAILNDGDLTIRDCTFVQNLADSVHPDGGLRCGAGGAIKSEEGHLVVESSTFQENTAMKSGGGIFVGCGTTARVENSIFNGNTAQLDGGGIHVRGMLQLTNSTITHNTATRWGGGICIHGKLGFADTVIADNSRKDCVLITEHPYKGVGTIVSNTRNRIADRSCPQGEGYER